MNIAILASGAGSNAANIIAHFKNTSVNISLIACNKTNAGVFKIATENGIESLLLTNENFKSSNDFINILKEKDIDLIILAGFLWQIGRAHV